MFTLTTATIIIRTLQRLNSTRTDVKLIEKHGGYSEKQAETSHFERFFQYKRRKPVQMRGAKFGWFSLVRHPRRQGAKG